MKQKENKKVLESAVADLEKIAGQKAVVTRAKKSVANFKLREGMPMDAKLHYVVKECMNSLIV